MLELLGMRSTPSLPSLQGPLWPEVGLSGATTSYLNKKSLRVFEFRDSYVLYMFYRYEHYMSISHMVLIVAM